MPCLRHKLFSSSLHRTHSACRLPPRVLSRTLCSGCVVDACSISCTLVGGLRPWIFTSAGLGMVSCQKHQRFLNLATPAINTSEQRNTTVETPSIRKLGGNIARNPVSLLVGDILPRLIGCIRTLVRADRVPPHVWLFDVQDCYHLSNQALPHAAVYLAWARTSFEMLAFRPSSAPAA